MPKKKKKEPVNKKQQVKEKVEILPEKQVADLPFAKELGQKAEDFPFQKFLRESTGGKSAAPPKVSAKPTERTPEEIAEAQARSKERIDFIEARRREGLSEKEAIRAFTEFAERGRLVREVGDIAGERILEGEEAETFEEFKASRLTEVQKQEFRDMGFPEEQIAALDRGELELGGAVPITSTDLGLTAAGIVGASGVAAATAGVAAKAKAVASTRAGGWIAAGAVLVSGDIKGIVTLPNDRIDAMETHAGKVGEASSELRNLALAGDVKGAIRQAVDMFDMLEEFDAKTLELAAFSGKALSNPEYLDNTRMEFWKSRNEVITIIKEIEIIAANPPEENLQTLMNIRVQQNLIKNEK